VIHRELDVVAGTGGEISTRYGGGSLGPEAIEMVRAQAGKRVALEFVVERTASWDHRKLSGVY
jgi:hypothetical protein